MLRLPIKRNVLAGSILIAFAAAAAAADEGERIRDLERRLQSSLAAIEQLQKRLDDVEQRQGRPATTAAAQSTSRVEAVESTGPQTGQQTVSTAASAKSADTGVPLHGFLDFGWAQRSSSSAPAGSRNGFQMGTLDIYLAPRISDRMRSLVELAFEYEEDGSLATDLERAQFGYVFSDALTLWAGRFHTPYGYWNTAFHHGAQIQTSITRPRFLAFEDQGGFLPAHSVGLWATGKTNVALGRVQYDAYLANGNRISEGVLDFNASGDDNGNVAAGLNVGFQPRAISGLTVGVHGLRQTVSGENADATATGSARNLMFGGYAFYESGPWELIGEYYGFRNKDLSGGNGTRSSSAGFVQAGYSIADRWTLFARHEKASLDKLDPYFALQESGTSYQQTSLGLRFALAPTAALKLQFDRNRDDANAGASVNWLRAQYAIGF